MAPERYRVFNRTRDAVLAGHSRRAANFLTRGIGLIGRSGLSDGEALIIEPCKSIVMFFMRFPLDVAFVDRDGRIVHLNHNIRPWRTSKVVLGSHLVIELPAGSLQASGTEIGDRIEIAPVNMGTLEE